MHRLIIITRYSMMYTIFRSPNLSKEHIRLIDSQCADDVWFCKNIEYIVCRSVSIDTSKQV